ncbi:hypothetical protein HF272_13770 [Rhizobium leguminosarum]|uniref:hypothetical protein n=1 Tax=Rhizobium leguminosarum TaxID=384 RepID=UPI001C90C779|nr:hypothetical protein [Rhizobium leguminosarum]MBY2992498.1 hypothetical protein [Rhizobium leguminosarum]
MNLPDLAQLPKSASDGPESWGQAFGRLATASDETQRVIENVVADDAARYDAYSGYIKEVQDATGVKLANPLDVDLRQGAFDAKPNPQISGGTGLEWRDQKMRASLDKFEADRERWAAQYPAQSSVIQLDVEGRVKRQQRAAEAEQARAAQSPELGTVARFSAQLLGGLKGTARDPYQWAMAVTGGGGSSTGTVVARIGKTMLTEALINGGQELVLQGASQERKKAAGLEYGMDDMLKNAGIAATFGALFGGTIEGGGAIARAYGLGEESAARASRILDGNPQRGDVEAMATDLGVTLTEEQKSQINRSFEERVLDEHMLPADASPDQVRVFEAAKNYAEDPDNFPEPELVERAIADEQAGTARTLTADDYERLYSGDPDAIDDIRDTFDAGEIGETPPPAPEPVALPTRSDGTSYEIGGGQLPEKGVVVANVNSDGRVYIGDPGDVHFSLADRYAGGDFGSPEFTGFINADGRIMDREEAFRWVADNETPVRPSENMGESLDALDYREQVPERLKKPAAAGRADPIDGITIVDKGETLLFKNADESAHLSVKRDGENLKVGITSVSKKERGKGKARELYEAAVNQAAEGGGALRSDIAVSNDAVRVYDSLRRRGYDVRRNPSAVATERGWVASTEPGNDWVFEVRPRRDDAPGLAVDPLDGQRIRPERAIEPLDEAAMRDAEQLAGDIVEPRIDGNGNPETLLDFVPLQDSDGNIRLVPTREALEAADQENWFADVLEACKV